MPIKGMKTKKFDINKQSGLHNLQALPSVIVLLLAGWYWVYLTNQIEQTTSDEFELEVLSFQEYISERFEKYEEELNSIAATMHTFGESVTLEKWQGYTSKLVFDKNFKGTKGFYVIKYIKNENLEDFLNKHRILQPEFTIYPAAVKTDYWPVTYAWPIKGNEKVIGLDIAQEKNRYEAALKAQKSGLPQLTAPIFWPENQAKKPAVVLFFPFYFDNNFAGLIATTFQVKNLINGKSETATREISVRISDGEEILYDELNVGNPEFDENLLRKKTIYMNVYGRTWKLDIQNDKKFAMHVQTTMPFFVIFTCITLSLLLFLIFRVIANQNENIRKYAAILNEELIKKNDMLVKSDAAKNEFIANISHELRTPLNTILGFSQIIHEEIAEKSANLASIQKYAFKINTAGKHLLKLISEILDLAKVESGKIEYDIKPINIRSFLAVFEESVYVLINAKNNRLIMEMDLDEDFFNLDETRLRQIFMNLVSNASKFTENGTITIKTKLKKSPIRLLEILVIDTGRGIAKENLATIFEKFVQVHDVRSESSAGTGLGLTITKKLVEGMAGSISVESKVGQGTIFSIKFTNEVEST
ncbi:CHASE domain-containing protein [Dolichospermum sp. ST_sed1]|nr:CHASE domain-containing protein [Dolichospermum sp. ST_sed1]